MKITQIRNATIVISYKEYHILVDPMLAGKGRLPRLRYLKNTQKNPLVELPEIFESLSTSIDYALITHCQKGHFDHLDLKGEAFLRTKKLPVFAHEKDKKYLEKRGLQVMSLKKNFKNLFFDGTIELVNAKHGTGIMSFLMEHGVGYFIKFPQMPSLYIMGDTLLTEEVKQFILANQPDYIVAPTGEAKFDFGSPILMTEMEIIELSRLAKGKIIANHMGALDHCRLDRSAMRELITNHSLPNILIPEDGEAIKLEADEIKGT